MMLRFVCIMYVSSSWAVEVIVANIQKRVSADGKASYRVRVRIKGQPVQSATFKRLTDAKHWAQDVESGIRAGTFFPKAKERERTVGDLINRYLERVLPQMSKSAQLKRGPQLEWWRGQIGPVALKDVSRRQLGEARDLLLETPTPFGKPRSPSTVVRYMAAMSHVFTWAIQWDWLDENPMKSVKKPKEPRGRVRFLSDVERDRLLEACHARPNPYLHTVVVIALSTGMRKGEILNLTWDDVDFERRRFILQHTKNGERRAVPMVGPALEVMVEHRKRYGMPETLVFPGKLHRDRPMDLRAPFVTALKHAGIENFRFHDLRHSTASYLAMSGASLAEIAEVLGHKTLSMVKRYAHLTEGHTESVMERMNAKFLG